MLCVLSGQEDWSEVRGCRGRGDPPVNRFVCVPPVVCLCLKLSECVYVCARVRACARAMHEGLACLSSPVAVIRRDIGSMTS